MALKFVERFQIYVLSVGNLAAGAVTPDLPLPLDSDAPFVLRGRGGRCQNDPRFYQAGMNGLLTRFRDASGNWKSDAPVPWFLDVPGNGRGGQWVPSYPNVVYPAQGELVTRIWNTGPGAVDLTNVQLYYVGTKRYPATKPYMTYPRTGPGTGKSSISVQDFVYNYWSLSPTNPLLPFQGALLPASAQLLYIPIRIQTDADFVLRSGQAGIYGVQALNYFYQELFVLLMDAAKKPYMNAPVHIDWLFGGGHQSVVSTSGDFYLPNDSESIFASLPGLTTGIIPGQVPLAGNWHPGLIYPEIYVPANTEFYFNLYRNDAGFTTAYQPGDVTVPIVPAPVNLHIAFNGSKVFKR
jgi:hypothetical protein